MAAPVGLTDIPVADNHCHAAELTRTSGVAAAVRRLLART
jgi:hypothetical protein